MINRLKNIKKRYTFLGILILGIVFSIGKYKYEHTFNLDRWIEYPRQRVKMIDDMFSKHDLMGKSLEEVREILGKETKDPYFKEDDNIVYYLGDERGIISIDSEWLVIKFEDGVVVDFVILRD